MIVTAVDTSVLLDVLAGDALHRDASRAALERASVEGAMVICPVVAAELRHGYESNAILTEILFDLQIHVVPVDLQDGLLAGAVHRAYRRAGGSRLRVVADFLIGAHAAYHADRLLARDRGFFRTHFTDLTVWDPTAG